ncbi:MAG: AgmX/PglI C-terminal domain-containing protein [Polyangiaceae bacterium]|nr:AgmX/PglI C-terminal domain-containing protein [Polyangiaceae bacterium]
MSKAVLTFALYKGDELLRRETVTQDIVKVGKDPKSHLQVDDELASRMHAVIEVGGPDDITLIDLGNDPGTQVNGARVNKCKIHVGDQIEVGGTRIVLESAEAAAAEAQPAAAAPAPAVAAPAPPAPAVAAPPPAPAAAPAAPAPAVDNPFASGGSSNPFASAAASNPFASAANPFDIAPANPFAAGASEAARRAALAVPDDAPPGTYTYTLVKSAPDVPADEVETHAAAVEVMVLWGTNVLHVSHLTPPRSFYVGEEAGKAIGCDFFIPAESLSVARMPVVLAGGGGISVVLPQGAKGFVEIPGQPRMTLDEARAKAQPCAELSGAHQLALPGGAKARVEVGDFVFQVAAVNAGKPMPVGILVGLEVAVLMYFALSFFTVGSLIAAMAFFVPPMGLLDDEGIDKDQLFLMQQYLKAAAEREEEEKETEQVTEQDADNKEGGTGTRAKGEEGSMGKQTSKDTNKRYAVQGPKDNPDPHIARQAALREAQEFGLIGLLNTGAAGDPNAPTAEWGRDTSLGNDEVSAMGNMWGDEIGDAYGAGGLGLSGIGEGGGGRGEGIGLGSIGTIGHGAGTGTGQGFGSGHGRLGGSHSTRAPKVRMGATSVSGRLPPEVIQRIVRQNYGRFRMCYENGLRNNPNLEGRVTVRFVIGRDGAVSNVSNGGSDIPDSGVVGCVVRAYYGLSFPQPEGGIVTVVYPIMFSPG